MDKLDILAHLMGINARWDYKYMTDFKRFYQYLFVFTFLKLSILFDQKTKHVPKSCKISKNR